MKPATTFEKSLSTYILSIFGIVPDSEGYAIDKHTGKRILAFDGKEFTVKEFAGVVKGKNGEVLFLKSDVGSLIEAKETGLL